MMNPDVLIAGAGPGGLATAIALAERGLTPLVVERGREISREPKATALSTRTMELLRGWGLAEEARAGGVEAEWRGLVVPTLADARSGGEVIDLGMPTAEQSRLVSPERPACVPQHHLEKVLRRRLSELGVPVRTGVSVDRVEADDAGARAVVSRATAGRSAPVAPRGLPVAGSGAGERVVEARYLVVAEGVRGVLRGQLGIRAAGKARLAEGFGVSFRAPLAAVAGEHLFGLYVVTDPAGKGVLLPAGPDDRWYYADSWAPGETPPDLAPDAVARRIRAAVGADVPVALDRVGRVIYGTAVAERFRIGNAFLVGDTAHRVTPRGGTGLNMAIHDGFDLGWKLAWVLLGQAGPDLLDTYEAERRPVAMHNAARSEQVDGSRRPASAELPVDLGGRVAHLPLPDGRSTLDLLGPGVSMFTADPQKYFTRDDFVTVAEVPPLAARRLGIPAGGALALRPDGVPCAPPRGPAVTEPGSRRPQFSS